MTDYIGNYKNRPRRVVFYGRVSTEHEEQLSALGNQMEWYTDLALRNPNWTVVAQYIRRRHNRYPNEETSIIYADDRARKGTPL